MKRESGNWNRNSRRSGGDRIGKIIVGDSTKALPQLAIQCFEGRHRECTGHDTLMGGSCECKCHGFDMLAELKAAMSSEDSR